MNALKATFWFGAGMATSELLLRWPVHLGYCIVILALVIGKHFVC